MQIKTVLFILLAFSIRLSAQVDFFVKQDTLVLQYAIDVHQLTEQQKQTVKDFVQTKDSIVSLKILSYADYLASSSYNQKLSDRRASEIRKELEANKPILCPFEIESRGQQLGENAKEKIGNSENRKVELIVGSWIFPEDSQAEKEPEKETPKPENKTAEQFKKLKKGDHFIAEGLNFVGGHHYLLKKSKPKLDQLLQALEENPNIHIEIQGHICCQQGSGDGRDEKTGLNNLSEARAHHIYQHLTRNGIEKERLSYKGFGAGKKIHEYEKNEAQRIENRRVEIVITKK